MMQRRGNWFRTIVSVSVFTALLFSILPPGVMAARSVDASVDASDTLINKLYPLIEEGDRDLSKLSQELQDRIRGNEEAVVGIMILQRTSNANGYTDASADEKAKFEEERQKNVALLQTGIIAAVLYVVGAVRMELKSKQRAKDIETLLSNNTVQDPTAKGMLESAKNIYSGNLRYDSESLAMADKVYDSIVTPNIARTTAIASAAASMAQQGTGASMSGASPSTLAVAMMGTSSVSGAALVFVANGDLNISGPMGEMLAPLIEKYNEVRRAEQQTNEQDKKNPEQDNTTQTPFSVPADIKAAKSAIENLAANSKKLDTVQPATDDMKAKYGQDSTVQALDRNIAAYTREMEAVRQDLQDHGQYYDDNKKKQLEGQIKGDQAKILGAQKEQAVWMNYLGSKDVIAGLAQQYNQPETFDANNPTGLSTDRQELVRLVNAMNEQAQVIAHLNVMLATAQSVKAAGDPYADPQSVIDSMQATLDNAQAQFNAQETRFTGEENVLNARAAAAVELAQLFRAREAQAEIAEGLRTGGQAGQARMAYAERDQIDAQISLAQAKLALAEATARGESPTSANAQVSQAEKNFAFAQDKFPQAADYCLNVTPILNEMKSLEGSEKTADIDRRIILNKQKDVLDYEDQIAIKRLEISHAAAMGGNTSNDEEFLNNSMLPYLAYLKNELQEAIDRPAREEAARQETIRYWQNEFTQRVSAADALAAQGNLGAAAGAYRQALNIPQSNLGCNFDSPEVKPVLARAAPALVAGGDLDYAFMVYGQLIKQAPDKEAKMGILASIQSAVIVGQMLNPTYPATWTEAQRQEALAQNTQEVGVTNAEFQAYLARHAGSATADANPVAVTPAAVTVATADAPASAGDVASAPVGDITSSADLSPVSGPVAVTASADVAIGTPVAATLADATTGTPAAASAVPVEVASAVSAASTDAATNAAVVAAVDATAIAPAVAASADAVINTPVAVSASVSADANAGTPAAEGNLAALAAQTLRATKLMNGERVDEQAYTEGPFAGKAASYVTAMKDESGNVMVDGNGKALEASTSNIAYGSEQDASGNALPTSYEQTITDASKPEEISIKKIGITYKDGKEDTYQEMVTRSSEEKEERTLTVVRYNESGKKEVIPATTVRTKNGEEWGEWKEVDVKGEKKNDVMNLLKSVSKAESNERKAGGSSNGAKAKAHKTFEDGMGKVKEQLAKLDRLETTMNQDSDRTKRLIQNNIENFTHAQRTGGQDNQRGQRPQGVGDQRSGQNDSSGS